MVLKTYYCYFTVINGKELFIFEEPLEMDSDDFSIVNYPNYLYDSNNFKDSYIQDIQKGGDFSYANHLLMQADELLENLGSTE